MDLKGLPNEGFSDIFISQDGSLIKNSDKTTFGLNKNEEGGKSSTNQDSTKTPSQKRVLDMACRIVTFANSGEIISAKELTTLIEETRLNLLSLYHDHKSNKKPDYKAKPPKNKKNSSHQKRKNHNKKKPKSE